MKKVYSQPIMMNVMIEDSDIVTASYWIGDGGEVEEIEEARVRHSAIWDD